MSSRQVRKLRELRGEPEEAEEPEEEEDSQDEQTAPGPSPAFALLAESSDSEPSAAPAPRAPKGEADAGVSSLPKSAKKPRKPRRKERAADVPQGDDAEVFAEVDREDVEVRKKEEEPLERASPLSLSRADFSVEAERQRVFGSARVGRAQAKATARARGQVEGRTLHHRRLFLVSLAPSEPWPKPDNTTRMVSKVDQDGAAIFGFEETHGSSRDLATLRQILSQEDPQLLQQYLQRNPFSLDGLLVMAEYHGRQGSHEQAGELVRRAVYTLECSLSPDFSPFQATGVGSGALLPRVRLDVDNSPDWPGWSWLRALWLHMHCLKGQGLQRTALEVCKLLLASTLPRDPVHAFLFVDYLCLRSRSYAALQDLAVLPASGHGLETDSEAEAASPLADRLDCAFPNVAYSVALCTQLARGSGSCPAPNALGNVSLDLVLSGTEEEEDWDDDMRAHARLLRALVLFPGCLRPLLDQCGIGLQSKPSGAAESWAELLASAPFSNAMEFRHGKHAGAHGRICIAYAKICAPFWKDSMAWLHACCVRWLRWHCSDVFAKDIEAARLSWASSSLAFGPALEDYEDVLTDTAENPPTPAPILERALTARLHPPRNHFTAAGMGGAQVQVPPNMSLHSPPAVLFFQSLLPWSELDQTGVQVSPLLWQDVALGIFAIGKGTVLVGLGALADIWRALRSVAGR